MEPQGILAHTPLLTITYCPGAALKLHGFLLSPVPWQQHVNQSSEPQTFPWLSQPTPYSWAGNTSLSLLYHLTRSAHLSIEVLNLGSVQSQNDWSSHYHRETLPTISLGFFGRMLVSNPHTHILTMNYSKRRMMW